MSNRLEDLEKRVAAIEKNAHSHVSRENAKSLAAKVIDEINKIWSHQEDQSPLPRLE